MNYFFLYMELEQFNDNTSYNLFRSDSMIIMVVCIYTHIDTRNSKEFLRQIPVYSLRAIIYAKDADDEQGENERLFHHVLSCGLALDESPLIF